MTRLSFTLQAILDTRHLLTTELAQFDSANNWLLQRCAPWCSKFQRVRNSAGGIVFQAPVWRLKSAPLRCDVTPYQNTQQCANSTLGAFHHFHMWNCQGQWIVRNLQIIAKDIPVLSCKTVSCITDREKKRLVTCSASEVTNLWCNRNMTIIILVVVLVAIFSVYGMKRIFASVWTDETWINDCLSSYWRSVVGCRSKKKIKLKL